MHANILPTGNLQGMRVGILLGDGFEESELVEPKGALDKAGAATFVISSNRDKVTSSIPTQASISVDIHLSSAKAEDFHGLLLPGGKQNGQILRMTPDAVHFVQNFMRTGKAVAAIAEGIEIILKAEEVRGRTITSSASLANALKEGGATYVDEEVVCDGNLITSRSPDDLPAFIREMIRIFANVREHSMDMRKIS